MARLDARRARPASMGLVSSVTPIADGTDTVVVDGETVRWANTDAFVWDPEDCSGGSLLDPCDTTGAATPTSPDDGGFTPYVVEASVQCSTFGSAARLDEHNERAVRKLRAVQSGLIEAELWAGTLSTAAGWGNASLDDANATLLEGIPLGYLTALSELEQAGAASRTGDVMIHATPRTITKWAAAGVIRKDGNLLTTVMGSVVVAGRGYPGTGLAGASSGSADLDYAFVTDPVSLYLGEIQVWDARPDGQGAGAIDRAANTVLVTATRFAAATFDGCVQSAVLVDQTTDLTTTGS